MENPHLPQEILVEIFSRIPTKSIGKCRTLSKSWNTHLSSPNFINKHLFTRKQTIRQENLALTTASANLCIITSPMDEVFKVKSGTDWWRVSGSCDGLILTHGSQGWVLMNPITLKQVTIPPLPERKDLEYYDALRRLGYDSSSDDYKIVEIRSFKPNTVHVFYTFAVYSVKNGVWKTLDVCFPYGGVGQEGYAFEDGVFVNGAFHWLLYSDEGGYRSCIAVWDLPTELFSEIPLPEELVRQLAGNTRKLNMVSLVGGYLSIFDNFVYGVTDVWIMKEYGVEESWVKFRIQAESEKWLSIITVLCYVEDGELLFLDNWGNLFACDLKSGTMKKVVIGELDYRFYNGMAFVDSLISPE